MTDKTNGSNAVRDSDAHNEPPIDEKTDISDNIGDNVSSCDQIVAKCPAEVIVTGAKYSNTSNWFIDMFL